MKTNSGAIVFSMLLLIFAVASCRGEGQNMRVMITKDQTCIYTGPSSIPYGKIAIEVEVEKTPSADAALFVFSLSEGKNTNDFQVWLESTHLEPGTIFSDWVITITFDSIPRSLAAYTVAADLSTNAAYDGSPLYIACILPDGSWNVLGPIRVQR